MYAQYHFKLASFDYHPAQFFLPFRLILSNCTLNQRVDDSEWPMQLNCIDQLRKNSYLNCSVISPEDEHLEHLKRCEALAFSKQFKFKFPLENNRQCLWLLNKISKYVMNVGHVQLEISLELEPSLANLTLKLGCFVAFEFLMIVNRWLILVFFVAGFTTIPGFVVFVHQFIEVFSWKKKHRILRINSGKGETLFNLVFKTEVCSKHLV